MSVEAQRDAGVVEGEGQGPAVGAANRRRVQLAETVALLWPLAFAAVTVSACALVRENVPWPAYSLAKGVLWWANGGIAVAGTVVAGYFTTRGRRRSASAIGYGVWAALSYGTALGLYAVNFAGRR